MAAEEAPSREQRLYEVLAAYFEAQEADQPVQRQELLDRHPDLAAELASFSAGEQRPPPPAAPVRPAAPARASTSSPGATTVPLDAPLAQGQPREEPLSIGGYQILGEIARGGMGTVYRARQVSPGRLVAL